MRFLIYESDFDEAAGLLGLGGAFLAVLFISFFFSYIFSIICMWKVFSKAGEPGWASIVPFYNSYVLFKISWGEGLLFLCTLIPIVGVIFACIMQYKLAKAFGKGIGFTLGLIFLSPLFMAILAFGSAVYLGVDGKTSGFPKNDYTNVPPEPPVRNQFAYCPNCGTRVGAGTKFCPNCGARIG